jgi:hypothetical protein
MNKAMPSLGDVLACSTPHPSSAHSTPPATTPEEQLLHQSAPHTIASARDKKPWQVNPTTISGKDIEGKVVTLYRDQPRQMSLFQTFIPRDEKYSNTIELYDAVPKYFPVKKVSEIRINDIYLPVVTREFHHKGQAYQVEIRPARITSSSWKI